MPNMFIPLQNSCELFVYLQAVTLHTDLGDLKIELFCDETPKTCEVRFI